MTQIISESNKLSSKDIYFAKMAVWLICLIQTQSSVVVEFRGGANLSHNYNRELQYIQNRKERKYECKRLGNPQIKSY